MFAPQLMANGLLPVSGVGGSEGMTPMAKAAEKTLTPGTSVSVQLVRGDYSISPGTDSLKELFKFEMTVTTAVSLIGISDAPKPRKGWPKA